MAETCRAGEQEENVETKDEYSMHAATSTVERDAGGDDPLEDSYVVMFLRVGGWHVGSEGDEGARLAWARLSLLEELGGA